MPSSKNSSDVWRKPKSSYIFFTYVCASIVILSACSFSVAVSMAAATILLPRPQRRFTAITRPIETSGNVAPRGRTRA